MKIKGITLEDFINYKEPSMFIAMPTCTWKCGKELCQNSDLALAETKDVSIQFIINTYRNNPLCKAVVLGGLEPFDTFDDLILFVSEFKKVYPKDCIVIYTGYNEDEIEDKINALSNFHNIIVKFGRYIPNQKPHYDEVLGIYLASDNQYAKKIN